MSAYLKPKPLVKTGSFFNKMTATPFYSKFIRFIKTVVLPDQMDDLLKDHRYIWCLRWRSKRSAACARRKSSLWNGSTFISVEVRATLFCPAVSQRKGVAASCPFFPTSGNGLHLLKG